MKILIPLMILLTVLTSCLNRQGQKRPLINNLEQLSPVFKYVEIDGKEYISLEDSKCLSRTYKISREYVGGIDKPIKLDIKECHKMVGYAPREYGVFATWLENMRVWLIGF